MKRTVQWPPIGTTCVAQTWKHTKSLTPAHSKHIFPIEPTSSHALFNTGSPPCALLHQTPHLTAHQSARHRMEMEHQMGCG